jgi:hypothetical protein
MKVLLIHTAKGDDAAAQLGTVLKNMGIVVKNLSVKPQDEGVFAQFTSFFNVFGHERKAEAGINTPTHVAILSSLSKRWFDFLAGYACASRLPFIVYGQDAIAGITEEFASCFTFLRTEASLHTYLEAENEAFKKQEAAREIIRAQETLLRMGIPVNGESLAHCAGEGHMQEIALFLAAGFSPDTRNRAGVPLISVAARKGNQEVVRFLIIEGAQLNLQADDRGTSALIDGVMGKHLGLVNDLIKSGADVNLKSRDGQTALVVAVGAGEEKIAETLVKAGADPDITDFLGASARKYAELFRQKTIIDLFNTYAPKKAEQV